MEQERAIDTPILALILALKHPSITKGQIKAKADWRAIDSPKKRTDEFGFFCFTVRKYLKLTFLSGHLNSI